MTVALSKMVLARRLASCSGCSSHDSDTDSNPETVTLQLHRRLVGQLANHQPDSRFGWAWLTPTASTRHVLIVATVSTASGNHAWYDSPDGANGIFVLVTDGTDDGRGSPGTEADLGRLKRPE